MTGIVARIAGSESFVSTAMLAVVQANSVQLQSQAPDVGRFQRRNGEVLLKDDVLDRKLIDVSGGRLVHANDLMLAEVDGAWRLVGVDATARGMLRRIFPMLAGPSGRHPIIDWRDIEPFVGHVPAASLLLPLRRLKRLHPAQIADLVERSTHDQGAEILDTVEQDPELAADVFEELDPEHQVEFLEPRSDEDAAQMLASMAPDDAVDLLTELDQDRRQAVLAQMPSPQHEKVRSLLRYNAETAGGMMSPDFIAVPEAAPVSVAIDAVRRASGIPDLLAGTVFLTTEDGKFVGVVGVADLLRMASSQPIRTAISSSARVRVDADLQEVALVMTDYNLTALAVEEADGRLVGAVSVDDVLEALVPEDWRRLEDQGE